MVRLLLTTLLTFIALVACEATTLARVLAESGGVTVYLENEPTFPVPWKTEADLQKLDGNLLTGTLRIDSGEHGTIIGINDLTVTNVHQVFFGGETPFANSLFIMPQLPAEWILADSRLAFSQSEICPLECPDIVESNDGSAEFADLLSASSAETGIGSIGPNNIAFPIIRNEMELAHLVGVPGTTSRVTLNVLGGGFESCEAGNGACFDFDIVWAVPEPRHGVLVFGLLPLLALCRKRE